MGGGWAYPKADWANPTGGWGGVVAHVIIVSALGPHLDLDQGLTIETLYLQLFT